MPRIPPGRDPGRPQKGRRRKTVSKGVDTHRDLTGTRNAGIVDDEQPGTVVGAQDARPKVEADIVRDHRDQLRVVHQ